MDIFQIIPMRSKSEAGMTFDRINRGVGVENKIFVDNASDQTGYNTEIHRVARLEIMDVCNTKPHSPWQNNMGASKYLPKYNIICVKFFLGLYIYHSNQSSMVINLLRPDKYESKYTCSCTNVQANIGQGYDQTRTDIRKERKDIRDYTFEFLNP